MTNFKAIVINNRKETKALSESQFESKEDFSTWKKDIEALRIASSACCAANDENSSVEVITERKTAFFEAYKVILAFFTDYSIGDKLKAQATDYEAILQKTTTERTESGLKEEGKKSLPVSATTFRKSIENFMAKRLTDEKAKTAEEIEAARIAKNKKKAADRKAKNITR